MWVLIAPIWKAAAGFFGSPAGRVVIAALAFLAWTSYQRYDAARDARAECDAAQVRVTLEELRRQNEIYAAALRDAAAYEEKNRREGEALRSRVDELVKNASDGPCDFGDGGVEQQLRNIK